MEELISHTNTSNHICTQASVIARHEQDIHNTCAKIRSIGDSVTHLESSVQTLFDHLNRTEQRVDKAAEIMGEVRVDLEAMRTSWDAVATRFKGVEDMVYSTHLLITNHTTEEKIDSTKQHIQRISEFEQMTTRLLKIVFLLSTLVFMLGAIWKVFFGPGLSSLISDIMGNLG